MATPPVSSLTRQVVRNAECGVSWQGNSSGMESIYFYCHDSDIAWWWDKLTRRFGRVSVVKMNALMRTTSRLTTALAIILILAFPVSYLVLAYEFNRAEVETEGRLEVINIQKFVDQNPDSWQRESSQLKELLGEMTEASHDHFLVNHDNLLRIENLQGNVIAQNQENYQLPPSLFFDTQITHSVDLLSNGMVVGKFIISRKLDNLARNILLSGLLGVIFGGMALFIMREYPLWALRRVIEKLENEKERAEVTLHCIGDAVVTTNANGLIEYLNPIAEQMLGWNSAEVLGMPLTEVFKQVDEKSGEPLSDPVRQVIRENPIAPLEKHAILIKKDGQQISIKSSVMPIRNKAGEVIGVVLGLHDVTQARALGAAEEANTAKGNFLANISHEIRTPLNGVLGMLQLMNLTELNADQREYVGVAHRSGESLMALLNDLLDFSKIEAGRLELELIEFDPRQLVEDVVALQASLVRDKDLNVMCLIGTNVPERLRGDPTRLRQVLENLVSNAIKFTERGEVLIQVGLLVDAGSVLYEHHADVDLSREGYTLHFSVSDTGMGVAQSQLKNIFEPFTQSDSSITRKHGGTGLGLAICQRLVHAMGGTIGVTGRANGGSVFSFVVQMKAAEQHPDEMWRPHPGLAGKRVLIVEDNGSNRMLLEHYFSSWGVRHNSIMSDVLAVDLCLREAGVAQDLFDAVVLGHQVLTRTAGQEIIRRIYGDPVQWNVKLIALRPIMVDGANRSGPEFSVDDVPADSADGMAVATAANGWARIACYVPHAYIPSLVRMHELHDALVEVLQLLPNTLVGESSSVLRAVVEHAIPSHTKAALKNEAGLVHPLPPEKASVGQNTISTIGKILVAEDDKVSQLIAAEMLGKMGFSADVAGDGAQALAACKLQFYDLVLMDMMMPVMDGVESTRQIRAMEATVAGGLNASGNNIRKPTIIIAVTANAGDSDRLNYLEAGVNDVIPKPLQFELLKKILARWLVNFSGPVSLSTIHSTALATPDQSRQPGVVAMNRSELVQLRELLAENFENTVRVFIEDTANRIGVLRDAVTRDDRDVIMRQAHTIKGSCSNFGALELSALCELLQQQLLAAEATDIKRAVEHIVQAFARVKIELEEMLLATPNIGLNSPAVI